MMADAPGAPRGGGTAGRVAEVLRFLVAGRAHTPFRFGVYPRPPALVATVAGVFFNFLTYGAYAFRRLDAHRLPRFLLAYGGIYAFNLALLEALRAGAGLGPLAAQLACLVVVTPTAYLVLRNAVFREKPHE